MSLLFMPALCSAPSPSGSSFTVQCIPSLLEALSATSGCVLVFVRGIFYVRQSLRCSRPVPNPHHSTGPLYKAGWLVPSLIAWTSVYVI